MAITKAEKYGWQPKSRDSLVGELVKVEDKELAPIDNLDAERFASEAASYYNDPKKYKSFLTGWWGRLGLKRITKAASLYDEYLMKLREVSTSSVNLQQEILQNKILYAVQVEIAYHRVKSQWELERDEMKSKGAMLKAETAHQNFLARFFDQTDPKNMSETSLILLSMLRPKHISTSSMLDSKSVEFGSAEGIMSAKLQEKVLEAYLNEQILTLEEKKEKINQERAKTGQEESKTKISRLTANQTEKDFKSD